ncbi:lysylphosphatidylglycerol synthase domain-containing protein [Pedobacter glucosidilyticus]|uniref:lysylphosphatidylglycerol synthase domain-containing protein n=1 Tax=Pedobacter glucosidilyticus TaxID=1122941 RepID=UPI0026F13B63|nr:lysylphosphatidylglycerol synthase domain-containing protein [Pedobacter glucosidilyticus]
MAVLTKQQKKNISYLIKISILLCAAIFIHKRLTDNSNLRNFEELMADLHPKQVTLTLVGIFLLMFFNWFLESIKWKFLIAKVEVISIRKAIESIFCGLTWAVFTPNRIGEYGGRIFFLSPRKRIQGAVLMSVGHISQMVITNIAGAIALLWFLHQFVIQEINLLFAIGFVIAVFCFFLILFYFNIHWLNSLLNKLKFLNRFTSYFKVLTNFSQTELLKVMLLSLGRFAVFTSQYILIIHVLVPEIPYYQISLLVFILFFVQSALPSLDLLDIGVRSMTATYFFSFITHQEIAIMAAASLIWLVNLIIPAILGSFFVFKLNFFD